MHHWKVGETTQQPFTGQSTAALGQSFNILVADCMRAHLQSLIQWTFGNGLSIPQTELRLTSQKTLASLHSCNQQTRKATRMPADTVARGSERLVTARSSRHGPQNTIITGREPYARSILTTFEVRIMPNSGRAAPKTLRRIDRYIRRQRRKRTRGEHDIRPKLTATIRSRESKEKGAMGVKTVK